MSGGAALAIRLRRCKSDTMWTQCAGEQGPRPDIRQYLIQDLDLRSMFGSAERLTRNRKLLTVNLTVNALRVQA
jgi:hypothetical protein